MNPLTTFVIPTLGRPTLKNAVDSILAQTLNNWKCIIGYDGIPVAPYFLSPKYSGLSQISIPKKESSSAGKIRNTIFPLVSTPWISFLDDDDALNIFYMYWLNRYENLNLDCIIFTMCYADGYKHPKDVTKPFICGDIGISFSVKMDFIKKHNLQFKDGIGEDFEFLNQIRKLGGKIKISEKEMYYIRPYLLHKEI